MGQRFVACDREQSFLMPPDVREWLAPGHLAWFVIDAVAEMDLDVFYAAYRVDGRARPAYDPAMMVALLLYAYARGMRSSRAIERACEEDVAFRVLAAQLQPDHATIARFRRAPPRRDRQPLQRSPDAVRTQRPGQRRCAGGRRHQGAGQRESERERRLRAARARDPRRSQGR